MFGVGNGWQLRGKYTDLDTVLDRYRAVTTDQVAKLAAKCLDQRVTETLVAAAPEAVA
jgi:predicted Zn-dependent peptidase